MIARRSKSAERALCDACVMRRVGAALGRREALAAAGLAALALSASPAAAQAVRAAPVARVVDLTHTLRPDFPTFGGDPAFQQERVLTFARDGCRARRLQRATAAARDGYNVKRFTYMEHVGHGACRHAFRRADPLLGGWRDGGPHPRREPRLPARGAGPARARCRPAGLRGDATR